MSRAMKDSGVAWIGEIPANWEVLPAQRGFTEVKRKNSDGAIQKALQFKFGIIVPKTNFDADDDDYVAGTILTYTVVEPGTVMINGLNLNYDFKTQRTGLVRETGAITSAYLALWPNQQLITSEYATYLFKGYETRMALHNMGAGIRLTLGYKEFKRQPVLFPPLPEQSRIAAFLDRRCAEIDRVITATQRTIEEYKKLKQSIITEAVTRGIRPGRKMKDSGVEWIGEIPEEWELIKGKALFAEVDARSMDGSEELLTVSQYTGITPRSQKNVNMFEAETLEGYKICEIGDIAANTMWLWAGAIGVSQYRGVISPSYNIYRTKGEEFVPDYLDYLLRIPPLVQHYESLSTGIRASRLRLYPQQFLSIRFLVPPIQEQLEILNFLKEKIVAMDGLIEAKQNLLIELEAFKKSVIYEYVTGKKEVPA